MRKKDFYGQYSESVPEKDSKYNITKMGIIGQKTLLEIELESLVIPKMNAAEEAVKLILDLPRLWPKANQEERRKLLLAILDAVYVDAKKTKSIVAIKPKPPF